MASPFASDEELREAGLLALREALGPDDALRFLRLFDQGQGDFTRDRVLYTSNPSLAEWAERIQRKQDENESGSAQPDAATAA